MKIQNKSKFILVLFFIQISQEARALIPSTTLAKSLQAVDRLDGSFHFQTSIHSNEANEILRLSYKSRSTHEGLIGLGWCLAIEKRIELISSAQIKLVDCDVDYYFKISPSLDSKRVVYDSSDPSRSLTRLQDSYRLKVGDDEYLFDRKGSLVGYQLQKQTSFRIEYENRIPTLLISDLNQKFKLHFDDTGKKVTRISQSSISIALFKKDSQLLIELNSIGNQNYNFRYDSQLNLRQITTNDFPDTWIDYENDSDLVKKVRLGSLCSTQYTYSIVQTKNLIKENTLRQSSCLPAKQTLHRQSIYRLSKDKTLSLFQTQISISSQKGG